MPLPVVRVNIVYVRNLWVFKTIATSLRMTSHPVRHLIHRRYSLVLRLKVQLRVIIYVP